MQNFGKIKNAFNGILVEAIATKNSKDKQLFGKYVKSINENKVLRTQFLIYNNIENKVEDNEFKANLFLQENLNLLNKFSKKEILEANEKLASILSVNSEVCDNENLYENISTLIFTERNSENIDMVIEATTSVIKYITENKVKETSESLGLPNSMLTSIMVEKYNNKYSDIDESDKKIIKTLLDSDDETKKQVYKDTIRECIDLINEKYDGFPIDTKEKLLKIKDKLLNDKGEINENYITNISKLVDLKSSLVKNSLQ